MESNPHPEETMKLKTNLEEIYAPVQEELDRIDDAILGILRTENPLSREVIEYFFSVKGKYLRPALCLFGASFSEEEGAAKTIVPVAASMEIFHSATLIHDDIVDSSSLRRNRPTVNAKWGPQAAVLVGDFLHDRAVATIFEAKNERLNALFLKTACEVCDGEILEYRENGNFDLGEEAYLAIIRKKTASLLSACIEGGALLARLAPDDVFSLRKYGLNLGMAFQIVDDCLDFIGEPREFGKTLGLDCAAGVVTLPVIRLLEVLPFRKKQEVLEILRPGDCGKRLERVRALMAEYETIEYSFSRAKKFTETARKELAFLRDVPSRKSLDLLLDFILERTK